MRKLNLLCIILTGLILLSCENETAKWEYKTIRVIDSEYEGMTLDEYAESLYEQPATPTHFNVDKIENKLNALGKDGWELVTSYTTIETKFPNFGEEKYHTGIKTNTRTQAVHFVLKRKIEKSKDTTKQ